MRLFPGSRNNECGSVVILVATQCRPGTPELCTGRRLSGDPGKPAWRKRRKMQHLDAPFYTVKIGGIFDISSTYIKIFLETSEPIYLNDLK